MKAIGECPLSTTIPPLPVSGISFRSEEITEVCTSNNRIDRTGVRARRFASLRSHPVLHGRRALRSRRCVDPPDRLRFRLGSPEPVEGLRIYRDTLDHPATRRFLVAAAGAIFPLCRKCHFRAAIPHNSARFDMRTPHRTHVTCVTLAASPPSPGPASRWRGKPSYPLPQGERSEEPNPPARRERSGTGR